MKAKRWGVLLVAIVPFLVSELFPPWRYEYWYSQSCPAGYSFITRPPAIKSSDEMEYICNTSSVPGPEQFSTHKDMERLNWQRVILMLLSAGCLLLLGTRRRVLTLVAGGALVGLGVLGLLFYLMLHALGL